MTSILFWPIIAGGLSAVLVFIGGAVLIERQRRIRARRRRLRSRLFK